MKTITLQEYLKKHTDYRGIWESDHTPEYIGKRTMLDYDEKYGTVLLIEGFSLKIIE